MPEAQQDALGWDALLPPVPFLDQELLARPPRAPKSRTFFLKALAHVGVCKFGEAWAEAQAGAMRGRPKDMAPYIFRASNDPLVASITAAGDELMQAILDKEIAVFQHDSIERGWDTFDSENLAKDVIAAELLFSGQYRCDNVSWDVFVDTDSLCARFPVSKSQPAPQFVEFNGHQLSPYLQLAIEISVRLGVSEANPVPVESLCKEVEDGARRFDLVFGSEPGHDLGKSLARSIAKIIRWPSARAGAGKGHTPKP